MKPVSTRGNRRCSGNVAMMMALCLLPLMMLIGFAFDGSRMKTAKDDLQASLDASLLYTALAYYKSTAQTDEAKKAEAILIGKAHFEDQIGNSSRFTDRETVVFDIGTDGRITGNATGKVGMTFAAIIGQDEVEVGVFAEAMAGGGRKVEIALVLDNSSSMFTDNRMQLMRGAARSFAHRMFDTLGEENVKISVVPWSATVNIMSPPVAAPDDSAYVNAMPSAPAGSRLSPDSPGGSPWTYTSDPFNGTNIMTRSQADAYFTPTEWRGCIRATPGERATDSSGNVTTPLSDAFPGSDWGLGLVPPVLTHFAERTQVICSGGGGGGGGGGTPPSTQSSLTPEYRLPLDPEQGEIIRVRRQGLCYSHTPIFDKLAKRQASSSGRKNAYHPLTRTAWAYPDRDPASLPVTETVDACLGDPNEFDYWSGGGADCDFSPSLTSGTPTPILPWDSHKAISGPNLNCPTAMLPASSNRRQVIRKLDHMYPVPGGTQADVGLMWGLRTLSPSADWTGFWGLSGAGVPNGWNDPTTLKIVVLLTDGINEPPQDFEGYYGCTRNWNTGYDAGDPEDFEESTDCWKSSDIAKLDKATLDNLMIDACTQMKDNYGIRIYSVAVDINDAGAISLLENCASSSDDFFNIDAADIDVAFSSVLTQVVRLSK